jgi:hypothetical protein
MEGKEKGVLAMHQSGAAARQRALENHDNLLQLVQHRLVKLTRGPVPREDLVRSRLFENLSHESDVTNLGRH